MRAGTHRDARAIDHHRHVVRVDAFQIEGDYGSLAGRIAVDAQRIDGAEALMRVVAQVRLMSGNRLAADSFHVFQRRAEPDRLDDRRRPGLEAPDVIDIGSPALKKAPARGDAARPGFAAVVP